MWWCAGFVILALLVGVVSRLVWRTAANQVRSRDGVKADRPVWKTRLFWLASAFVPSALMLAVTNHVLLNLASVPFLWILPLAVYLVTFMIAFGRRIQLSLELVSTLVAVILLLLFPFAATSRAVESRYLLFIVAVHMLILMAGALLCHTALALATAGPRTPDRILFLDSRGRSAGRCFYRCRRAIHFPKHDRISAARGHDCLFSPL